jgi:Niemann-Pick C1 protein
MAFLQKASNLVTKSMEDAFFRWGKFVARHPYPVICTSLLITALTSVGFIKFRMEHQATLLWINSDSSYNIHEKWLQNNFKKNERTQILLVKNDNVLTPESNNLMFDLHKKIQAINSNGK